MKGTDTVNAQTQSEASRVAPHPSQQEIRVPFIQCRWREASQRTQMYSFITQ